MDADTERRAAPRGGPLVAPGHVEVGRVPVPERLARRDEWTTERTAFQQVAHVSGTLRYRDGHEDVLDADALTRAPESALGALSVAMVALALALVWLQLA